MLKIKPKTKKRIIKIAVLTSILSLIPLPQSGANNNYELTIEQRINRIHTNINKLNSVLVELEPKIMEYIYFNKLAEIGYTSEVRENIESSLISDNVYKKVSKQYQISKEQYMMLKFASNKLKVPLEKSVSVMIQESWGDPNAISLAGCVGDMQLNVGVALAYNIPIYLSEDLKNKNFSSYKKDLEEKLKGKTEYQKYFIDARATLIGTYNGVRLLKELIEKYDCDDVKIYLDYNGGPSQVQKPTENALAYVNKIIYRENLLKNL
ncbi:MAG: hypothetical protein QXG00_00735 [Candidatus Woesearchaeota archaeon]